MCSSDLRTVLFDLLLLLEQQVTSRAMLRFAHRTIHTPQGVYKDGEMDGRRNGEARRLIFPLINLDGV